MDKENQQKVLTPKYRNNLHTSKNSCKLQKIDKSVPALEQKQFNNKAYNQLGILCAEAYRRQFDDSSQLQSSFQIKYKLLENPTSNHKNSSLYCSPIHEKLQIQLKQQKKSQQRAKQKYEKQIQTLETKIKDLQTHMQNLAASHHNQIEILQKYHIKEIQAKNNQFFVNDSIIREFSRSQSQQKAEKEHITDFIAQRKEADAVRDENNKIIAILKQKQLQIYELHQMAQKDKEKYLSQIQNCKQKMMAVQNQFHIKLQQKTQAYLELQKVAERLKTRLKQAQFHLAESLQKHLQLESNLKKSFEKEKEKDAILNKNKSLFQEVQQLQEKVVTIQRQSALKVNQLIQERQHLFIKVKQISLEHELQLHQIRELKNQGQAEKNKIIFDLQNSILKNMCQKAELQKQIGQLSKQVQVSSKDQLILQSEIEKLRSLVTDGSNTSKNHEKRDKDIQRLLGKFKKQLENFTQVINQKEIKIQSYRKEILDLRRQAKQRAVEYNNMQTQMQFNKELVSKLLAQKKEIETQIEKFRNDKSLKRQDISSLAKQQKGQNKNACIQAKAEENKVQLEKIQVETLIKELQKAKLRYENVIQELVQHKKEFKLQLQEKEDVMQELKKENQDMKKTLANRYNENKEIQLLLDLRIQELKEFYEEKIEQEGGKYRNIIENLKNQMSKLQEDIELKKSIQQQMFKEIMRINKQRNSTTFQ